MPSDYEIWSADSSVPDGGSTIALLGVSLIGVDRLRRKIAKP
jgi:hypothetical protein